MDNPEFVTLDAGLKIAYYRFGNPQGIPLVLIHGFMSHALVYEPLISPLEDDFNILAFDIRGYGASDKPIGNTYDETLKFYSLELFAQDIFELLKKIAFPAPCVVLGYSMGGMIAQVFALTYPDVILKLVLISTTPTYQTDNMRNILRQYKTGEMGVNEENFRMTEPMGSSLKWRKANHDAMEELIQYKLTIPKDIYIASLESFVEGFDVRDRLKNISQPTLVMSGKRDGIIAYTYSVLIAENTPNSKLVLVPKQSHNIIAEATDKVVAELKEFCRLS